MGVEGEGTEGEGAGEGSEEADERERGGDGVVHCWEAVSFFSRVNAGVFD